MSSDDRVLEFSELLQASRSRVYGLIYAIVLNNSDTEDLFQQTALLLWERFGEFRPGTDFAAWALQIARFKSANFVRQRRREQQRLSTVAIEGLFQTSVASADVTGEARLEALKGCLAKLSASERALLMKCYEGGSQIKDIAQEQGKTAGAVYGLLHRIRKSLLECVRRQFSLQDHPLPHRS